MSQRRGVCLVFTGSPIERHAFMILCFAYSLQRYFELQRRRNNG